MHEYGRKILAYLFVAVFTLVFCGAPVFAQDATTGPYKDPGVMAADVALARPVGAVATVAGFALFLVSSPFSALGGNSQEAWESLVVSPATYTFKRPLGHFDEQPSLDAKKRQAP